MFGLQGHGGSPFVFTGSMETKVSASSDAPRPLRHPWHFHQLFSQALVCLVSSEVGPSGRSAQKARCVVDGAMGRKAEENRLSAPGRG